ncbi:MAG: TetR/AcrR family transcriptional regulator [Proteobacteria bacterium]|nr:TetR/AcrR family transcriptional regulator [Pseudomonadota bacterium]
MSKTTDKPFTAKGAATRRRIIETAADLVAARGVSGATLDDILADSAASKSQFYHYFADKDALIGEVIKLQTERVFAAQGPRLASFASMAELRLWRDAAVALSAAKKRPGGCPLGSLAYQLGARSKPARLNVQASFDAWASFFVTGLVRMQKSGELMPGADCVVLGRALLAALQGGLLLTLAAGDVKPLEIALDMGLDHVARHLAHDQPGRGRQIAREATALHPGPIKF